MFDWCMFLKESDGRSLVIIIVINTNILIRTGRQVYHQAHPSHPLPPFVVSIQGEV